MQEITMTRAFSIAPDDNAVIVTLADVNSWSSSKALRAIIREYRDNHPELFGNDGQPPEPEK